MQANIRNSSIVHLYLAKEYKQCVKWLIEVQPIKYKYPNEKDLLGVVKQIVCVLNKNLISHAERFRVDTIYLSVNKSDITCICCQLLAEACLIDDSIGKIIGETKNFLSNVIKIIRIMTYNHKNVCMQLLHLLHSVCSENDDFLRQLWTKDSDLLIDACQRKTFYWIEAAELLYLMYKRGVADIPCDRLLTALLKKLDLRMASEKTCAKLFTLLLKDLDCAHYTNIKLIPKTEQHLLLDIISLNLAQGTQIPVDLIELFINSVNESCDSLSYQTRTGASEAFAYLRVLYVATLIDSYVQILAKREHLLFIRNFKRLLLQCEFYFERPLKLRKELDIEHFLRKFKIVVLKIIANVMNKLPQFRKLGKGLVKDIKDLSKEEKMQSVCALAIYNICKSYGE